MNAEQKPGATMAEVKLTVEITKKQILLSLNINLSVFIGSDKKRKGYCGSISGVRNR